ncbi:MAG TPA: hypothetical protein DHN33_09040 [Eubacteriaceae bacterium]|nr:hypothetical protein [Eubacteriaceae bacterium]
MKIIIGKSSAGKTTYIHRCIQEKIKEKADSLIVIVPEQYTLEAEKQLMKDLKAQGLLQVEVLSFSRLVDRLLTSHEKNQQKTITDTGKTMMIKRIIMENREKLTAFSRMANKNGFAMEIFSLIQDMREKMIEPEQLQEIKSEGTNALLDRKISDVTLLFQQFENRLEEGNYLDYEKSVLMAVHAVKENPWIKESTIWVDGFHTFNERIMLFLEALENHAKELTVTLSVNNDPTSKDREIYSISQDTFEKLTAIAKGKPTVHALHNPHRGTDLDHLKSEFFSYPYKKFDQPVRRIKVIQEKNVYNEIDRLCMEIIKKVRDEGVQWSDISVISNNIDEYSFLMKRTMEEYNIPYFIDVRRSVQDNPLVQFILGVLRCVAFGFRYEDVFAVAKAGFFEGNAEDYEQLENYCLRFGIKPFEWKKGFEKNDADQSIDLEWMNAVRRRIAQPILDLKESISKEATFSEVSKKVYKFMREQQCAEKTDALTRKLIDRSELDRARENTQVYNGIVDLLDEVVEIFREEKTTMKLFYAVFETGIEDLRLGVLPYAGDVVQVGDIKRSRTSGVKQLFVLGLNEGILPGEANIKGIFTNSEEEKLAREKDLKIAEGGTYQSIQEKFLFHTMLSKVSDGICFSYALSDYEGSSLRPSPYVYRLKELFTELEIDGEVKDSYDRVTNSRGTFKHMAAYYRTVLDQNEIPQDPVWKQIYKWYAEHEPEKSDLFDRALRHQNKSPRLASATIASLYGKSLQGSVTSLETYAKCPYRYFIRYGLRPKERKIHEVSMPDIGQILHEAIYQYGKMLDQAGQAWTDVSAEQRQAYCDKIIEGFQRDYKQGVFLAQGRYKYLIRYLKRVLLRGIEVLTVHLEKGLFTMEAAEVAFGKGKEIAPIAFKFKEGFEMVLQGVIDRVDLYEKDGQKYVKIIDYKTGNKTLEYKDVYYGLSLQLLIYLEVLLRENPDYKPAGAVYFKLDDPIVEAAKEEEEKAEKDIRKQLQLRGLIVRDQTVVRAFDRDPENSDVISCKINKNGSFAASNKGLVEEEEFRTLLDRAVEQVEGMGRQIVEGNIEITPARSKGFVACDYCDYKNICQFDTQIEGNRYRYLQHLKDDEVLEKLSKEKSDE